jgi:hypothetical protein
MSGRFGASLFHLGFSLLADFCLTATIFERPLCRPIRPERFLPKLGRRSNYQFSARPVTHVPDSKKLWSFRVLSRKLSLEFNC